MKHQSLRQVFKITQWKDGCVFKTKPVGYCWLTIGYNYQHDSNLIYSSVSTSLTQKILAVRTVSDDTPDMDITTLKELGVE